MGRSGGFFAQRLRHEPGVDAGAPVNRRLAGWANFYQYTDYTATMYGQLDQIVFWKLARWLARKLRCPIKTPLRRWFRRPPEGTAKTWVLWGRSGQGHICKVALRRLVTSPKRQFRWRNPPMNPYILRDEESSTVTSRYHNVAMGHS